MSGGNIAEVRFIEDIDQIGQVNAPAIMFRRMKETTEYLDNVTEDGLRAWRAQGSKMEAAGIISGKEREYFCGVLRVSGWHQNAENSTKARERLEDMARPFFPKTQGRDGFLADLSRTVSRYAAAANARDLMLVFDASQRRLPHGNPRFTFEPGSRTQGHIQLAGSSLLLADPKQYTADIWRNALSNNLTPAQAFSLLGMSRGVPERSLAAWQGRDAVHPVLTAPNPMQVNDFRLSVRLHPLGERGAHPFAPNLFERIRDWRKTSDFQHG